jgi:hypothetical protein
MGKPWFASFRLQIAMADTSLSSFHAISKTFLCIVLAEPLFSFSPSLPHTWDMAEFFACLLGTVPLEPVDQKPHNRLALTENTCFLR